MIVDAHLHVWDPHLLRYPWLDDEPELGRPFLPEPGWFRHGPATSARSLLSTSRSSRGPAQPAVVGVEAGVVDRQVFVQADCADGLAEARWVQSLAPDWPQLHGIVAHAPVESGPLEEVLDQLEELPLLVGVRRLLQDEPNEFLESPELLRGLRALAERRLPFDACIRHHQLPALLRLAREVPELTVVLDHLGKPPVTAGFDSDAARAWVANLAALADAPNTFVKLSGLAPEADPASPLAEQVVPFLDAALEAFGPERTMVGSDFPVSAHSGHGLGYREWFDLVAAQLGTDREQVLGRTALSVYRSRVD